MLIFVVMINSVPVVINYHKFPLGAKTLQPQVQEFFISLQ